MHTLFAALTLFSLLAHEASGRTVNLALPHALREGETAWLLVTVGVIPRGAEIEITSPSGRLLGVISPYGIRSGSAAGTYTVPLPADAISGRRLWLRLMLDLSGKQRPPTAREVKKVQVKIREGHH
jgi:hypothetical protein